MLHIRADFPTIADVIATTAHVRARMGVWLPVIATTEAAEAAVYALPIEDCGLDQCVEALTRVVAEREVWF